ncbi:MAG TPA: thiamine pyrophosphate-dependent dehydrogenase E1 component subunit alpha [Dehalococcoidales bacterium]|nr:thiamine pyrophosphate-dependent dehydrogenase E1 component subunit alpha [Dehalococcoidales bacterium]
MVNNTSPEGLRKLYTTMLTIRRLEERLGELVEQREIQCPTHLYIGQEAVAAGVCANLKPTDWVFSNHRNHGHYIAKGGDLKALVAECYVKSTGASRGRGGSMHPAQPEMGLPGSPAILSGSLPLAVGAALAFRLQGKDSVAVVFFGDGAANEGVFYESLNLASLKRLPVVFICENNLYATHMPVGACLANTELYRKAAAFCIPGLRIDGNNVVEVYKESGKAIAAARRGRGPTLLECMTYRWRGHVGPSTDVDRGLRSQAELDAWMARCPVDAAERLLKEKGGLTDAEKAAIEENIAAEIEAAVTFARRSPYPDDKELLTDVFKEGKCR